MTSHITNTTTAIAASATLTAVAGYPWVYQQLVSFRHDPDKEDASS